MTFFWLAMLTLCVALAFVNSYLAVLALTTSSRIVSIAATLGLLWAAFTVYNHLRTEFDEQHPAAVIDSPVTSGKTIT